MGWLSTQVRRRRCATCWGPVILKWVDGEWILVCPKSCEPGGNVSEDYVDYRRAVDRLWAAQVAAHYPMLVPHLSREEMDRGLAALYGEA